MDDLLGPADIEQLAASLGLTVKEVCARAGVAHTTFYRWRAGTTRPTLDVYERICGVLRDAGAKRPAA